MGMAYANRSAVYFECKLYEICLENIELALNYNYPKNQLPNLTARKEKCLKFLSGEVADDHPLKKAFAVEESLEKKFDLKLSYEPHPQFPFMISSLQMNKDSESGRKFVSSNIDLKPGDVIAVEDGFLKTASNVVMNLLPYQHCRECFSENLLNLRPCEFCVLNMYCSEKCRGNMQEFHQHRCDLVTSLIGYVNPTYAACKLFSHALGHFETIENLKSFIESTDGTTSTMFDFDFAEPTKDRENYLKLIINSMPQGWKEWKIPDGQMKAVNHYIDIFFAETELKKLWAKHKTFIKAFIVRAFKIEMTQKLTLTGFAVDEKNNAEGIERVKFGTTGSAFSGLFHAMNHSCCTNTDRLPMNGKIYIIMMRPVKAGQELTAMKQ